jgi:hypothetical protein
VLLRNVAGKFEKAAAPDLPSVAGRGAAFGDLNNDGYMDAIVSVLGGRPLVFLNRGGQNHWLTLRLVGERNRSGAGAIVKAGKQWVYATTSGSYLSASDERVHFGLGTHEHTTVEIVWPGGKKQVLERVAADQIITVKEVQ